MEDLKKVFAGKLLAIKAVKLQPNDPFTWASGWKSPFYCDNRQTLSYHDVRSFVKLGLTHAVLEHFPEADAVAGVATGAIAQGVLVADELALPYAYVRPKPKDHGMKNQIEGRLPEGAKVVVVEDLISTGGSSLKAVAALREAGFEVVGMVASFTYGFPIAEHAFKEAGVKLSAKVMHTSEFIKSLKLKFSKKAGKAYYLESDYLKNYNDDMQAPRELLAALKTDLVPFGTNNEESYTCGEGAVVLPKIDESLVAKLAKYIEARADDPKKDLIVVASPYTKIFLTKYTALNVKTLEELAAACL